MTKPTRIQEQACERLVEALLLIAEGTRLDGKRGFSLADFREIGARLAKASSAFELDEVVARALERRSRSLGFRAGMADLVTLMEGDMSPLAMLLLPDADFRERIEALDRELGEV